MRALFPSLSVPFSCLLVLSGPLGVLEEVLSGHTNNGPLVPRRSAAKLAFNRAQGPQVTATRGFKSSGAKLNVKIRVYLWRRGSGLVILKIGAVRSSGGGPDGNQRGVMAPSSRMLSKSHGTLRCWNCEMIGTFLIVVFICRFSCDVSLLDKKQCILDCLK